MAGERVLHQVIGYGFQGKLKNSKEVGTMKETLW